MSPFYISCTTCKARLKIRDESAVGEIHTCPKCGSMVMITPPRGDSQTGEGSSSGEWAAPASMAAAAAPLAMTFDDAVEILNQTAAPPASLPVPPAAASAVVAPPATGRPVDLWSDTVDEAAPPQATVPAIAAPPDVESEFAAVPAERLADTVDAGEPGEFGPSAGDVPDHDFDPQPLLPGDQWISPQAHVWRQWVLVGGSAVTGIALAVAVFGYAVVHTTRARRAALAEAAQNASLSPATEAGAAEPAEAPESPQPSEAETATSEGDTDSSASPSPGEAEAAPSETSTSSTASDDSDEPAPPAPPAESPFDTSPPAPVEVASNGDLLDRFGEFLGAGETPPSTTVPPTESPDLDAPPSEASSASESDAPAAEETPLPRPAPRTVDVAARLSDPIAEIEFTAVGLVEFLEFVSDLSTIPISIEPEALAWRRLSPSSAVSVREKETTVEGVLLGALTMLNLAYVVEDGHLLVTGAAAREARLRTIKHPVEDLTGRDAQRLADLGDQITRLVAPESWKTAGGEGALETAEGNLAITQTEAVHFRIIGFCEALRLSRGMPQKTRFDAALFQPQAQQQAAREKLAAPVTFNFRHPAELTTILTAFGKAAGITILVDWRAAADAGWPPDAKGSVVADGGPLSDALTRLLSPMDLTYRIVDGSTLEITTPEILRTRIETEFYPVSDLLAGKPGEAALLDRIRNEMGEHLAAGRGAVHFDAAGKHLIAAFPQPQHDQLAALLESLRKP